MTPAEASMIALRARAPAADAAPAGAAQLKPPKAGVDPRVHGIPHPAPDTIHIAVNARTGDITFHPSILHVGAGKSVHWVYTNGGPFTISFVGGSPFTGGRSSLHSVGYRLTSPTLPHSAVGKHFQYGVAARVSHGQHQGKIAVGHGGGTLVVSE